jgi:hypothetical protein
MTDQKRGAGRPFQKGVSGNPGGRSKALRDVEAAAREHTPTAIKTLADICGDAALPPSARVSAAIALLDRGHGKPAQTISATHRYEIDPEAISDAELANSRP